MIKTRMLIYKYRYYILCFLFALLPRIILNLFAIPVRTLTDEVTTMSGAAYFAGLDWTNVISHSNYYGTGFTALMFPIFLITDNPYIIYKSMLVFCSVVQSLAAPICFYILDRYFETLNIYLKVLISCACAYLVATRTMIVYNEHALILVSWVLALLLFKLQEYVDHKNKKLLYTIILFIVLSYTLTIHERALTYWIAFAITWIFYFWVNRKSLVSIPVIALGAIGYFFGKLYVAYIQNSLWDSSSGEELINTTINVDGKLQILLLPETWTGWLNTILGQINTIAVATGGIILICIVIAVSIIWRAFVKGAEFVQEEDYQSAKLLFPVFIFFSACIAMTILAQSLIWLNNTTGAMIEGFGNSHYGTKAFTYIRYFAPYCGPFLMCGLVYMCSRKKDFSKLFKYTLIIAVIFQIYWVFCIVPYICRTTQVGIFEVYYPFSGCTKESITRLLVILPASLVMFLFLGGWGIWMKKKKCFIVPLICLNLLLVYQYVYNAITWDLYTQQNNYLKTDGGYALVESIKEKVELPSKIYVLDNRENITTDIAAHQTYFQYQFMFNKYSVVPNMPQEENAILFVNYIDEIEYWIQNGYQYIRLDDNEICLIKGTMLQQEFKDAGIELQGGIE